MKYNVTEFFVLHVIIYQLSYRLMTKFSQLEVIYRSKLKFIFNVIIAEVYNRI